MEVSRTVHGFDPQTLIEKISRERITQSLYWKEECVTLDIKGIVEHALELDHIGGMYGAMQKSTPFLCLILRMVQILPDINIAIEFINREKFKYARCLGAFFVRLVGDGLFVYQTLEPLLLDYRRVKLRNADGSMRGYLKEAGDEFMNNLLSENSCLGIALPRLPKRIIFEKDGKLDKREKIIEELGLDSL